MTVVLDASSRARHPEKAHRPDAPALKKPDWIRVKAPVSKGYGETRAIVRYAGKETEVFDYPADNHLGRNLDYFAKAAMGQGTFPIPPAGILQTAAALEAVFKSVDADGAWMAV